MKLIFLTLIFTTAAFGQGASFDGSSRNNRSGSSYGSSYNDYGRAAEYEPVPRDSYDYGPGSRNDYNRGDSDYEPVPRDPYEYDSRTNRDARPETRSGNDYNRRASEYGPAPRGSYENDSRSREVRPRQGNGNQSSGQDYAEESLASAVSIMNRVELRGNDQRILAVMRSKAANLELQVGTTEHCLSYAAYKYEGKVFICPAFYNNRSIENGQYMILHEIVHLGGIKEECDADRFAGKILAAAGEPVMSNYGCSMN